MRTESTVPGEVVVQAPCPQCGRGAQWVSRQFTATPRVICEPCDTEEGRKHDG